MNEPVPRPHTHVIAIEQCIPDCCIVISLREMSPKRFIITFSRESLAGHAEVIEEWHLRHGNHCIIEFDEDETWSLDDRIKLLFGSAMRSDDVSTTDSMTILDFFQ